MQKEFFSAIVERLCKDFGLTFEMEHELVYEFFEGPIPLFKLILAEQEIGQSMVMMISFHIEVEAPNAIQWWVNIRQHDPFLHLTAIYLKDAEGVSYVGEDAQVLRMYMMEQDVIAAFAASDKDMAEEMRQELPTVKPSPLKTFTNYRAAVAQFKKMQKKKGDLSH